MEVQSVSEVVLSIKNLLEDEFVYISVEGEISNLSSSSAGHYYFTLSDSNSSLSCALFKMDAMRNPLIRRVKDGDKVIIAGPISVYQRRGSFQLITKRITPVGKGDLKAQFEKLKSKLAKDGYFDLEHKKEIPSFPKRIAVITALQGAALQDFLNIMKRRSMWYDIVIIPATVQGDKCPSSVVEAIDKVEQLKNIDVVVITRGGGSLEDLWGFNSVEVVKAAFDCETPIISAIGHQVDYSLLDFVSDLRCETPSAAAEILTQEHTVLLKKMKHLGSALKLLGTHIHGMIEGKLHKLNPLNILPLLKNKFKEAYFELKELDPKKRVDLTSINQHYQYIDELVERMTRSVSNTHMQHNHSIIKAKSILESLNPQNVLERGYTILSTNNGKVLTSQKEFDRIQTDSELTIRFNDGEGRVHKK